MGKREEAAFQKAKLAIAKAKASNATSLILQHGEGFEALDRLPEEIGDLTGLTSLSVFGTNVRDIDVLANLASLKHLDLSQTRVHQIDALAGLTGLTDLNLWGTRVSQIDALVGLTELTDLDLSRTQVSQIVALAGLTGLTGLNLSHTQVMDMRPLRGLAGLVNLVEGNPWEALYFADTPATRRDPDIARIAEIRENGPRAQALFDYLADWVPDVEVEELPASEPTGLRYQVGQGGQLGYDLAPSSPHVTPEMAQLHQLLCEDCDELLTRFPLGANLEYAPLHHRVSRYRSALGGDIAALTPILVWKFGNDLRVLSRANRDRMGNSLGEMPFFGADLTALLDSLIATHNVLSSKHPELSAFDLAQIDPVDRQRAEVGREQMAQIIEEVAQATRIILRPVIDDLRDLHQEAMTRTESGWRAHRIEEDSLRNLITEIVSTALLQQRQSSGLAVIAKDARSGIIGAAAGTFAISPELAAVYPQLVAAVQPYLGALMAGWHGKDASVKQAVDWIVWKMKAGPRQ